MKGIFKILAQSDTFAVPSQKAEGGQVNKCNIILQDVGGKYENSYVAHNIEYKHLKYPQTNPE